MHLDRSQKDTDNAATLFERFLFCNPFCNSFFFLQQPLWKIPDFKPSPPRQSIWSSNQNLQLNLALPLQLDTRESRENGVRERQGGAGRGKSELERRKERIWEIGS